MRKAYIFLIALAVLGLDQWSKFWARANLTDYRTLDIIPDHFRLFLNFNTGGAWSILSGNVWVLAAVSSIVSLGLIYYILRYPLARLQSIGLGLVLGGAVGNLVDRLLMQRVTDFFDAYVGIHHFPTFNVADMGIDIGVGLLFLMYAFLPEKKENKEIEESGEPNS
ncbi:MAG TPA: signal peptidase II [Cyanobacteria bacterium UBA8530]|nr:signal peptidase II [Cyanobacteria bacterium UBA8530]